MDFSKDYLRSYVGKKIMENRKERKISQQTLAASLGCSRPTISSIENGEKSCSIEMVYAVAFVFKLSPFDFLPIKSSRNLN